jgi:HSP20 family protein
LTISGEKKHENTEVSKGGYFSEISYGHVSRTIPLPWDLDYSKASAEFNNGVLSVSIPKSNIEQENKRKISINKTAKKTKKTAKKNT